MIAIVCRSFYEFKQYIQYNVKDITFENYSDKYIPVTCYEDLSNKHKIKKAIFLYSAIRLNDYNKIVDWFNQSNITIEDEVQD